MRCKTPRPKLRILFILMFIGLLGGCHLERGKLYFDKLGLDPITVYQMAPLEKTVFCLTEAGDKTVEDFAYLYDHAFQAVENDLESDWSELVCLSLSGQVEPSQLAQTIKVLDLVLLTQPQQSHPVAGFQALMKERLDLYSEIDEIRLKLQESDELLAEQLAEQDQTNAQELKQFREVVREQNKKIFELEQQVRELKDIELLLHPKQ